MRAGTFTLMLALGIMTAPALAEEESLPDQIVDALNKADGAFPGYRATHAKGLVAEGNFKPTREAGVEFTKIFSCSPQARNSEILC